MMSKNSAEILVGQFLYSLRIERNLSQDELANRAGVVVNTVSRLERGLTRGHRATNAKLLSVLRAVKDLTSQEKNFVKSYMNILDDYSLDTPEANLLPFTMDVLSEHPEIPLKVWIDHTVSEIVSTVGRKRSQHTTGDRAEPQYLNHYRISKGLSFG